MMEDYFKYFVVVVIIGGIILILTVGSNNQNRQQHIRNCGDIATTVDDYQRCLEGWKGI